MAETVVVIGGGLAAWEILLAGAVIVLLAALVVAFISLIGSIFSTPAPSPRRTQRRCVHIAASGIGRDQCKYSCNDIYSDGSARAWGDIVVPLRYLRQQKIVPDDTVDCPHWLVIPL
jgi:hypothetical protein